MPLTRSQLARSWRSWYMSELAPKGPGWLQWVWTVLFCMVIALCFTMLSMAINALDGGAGWSSPSSWWRWYRWNLVVSLTIGVIIHLLFLAGIRLVGAQRLRGFSQGQRTLFYTGVPLVGVMIGWPLGVALVRGDIEMFTGQLETGKLVGVFLFALLITFIFFQIFSARAQQAVAEQCATEAQLRLLQAQMEPHFLFNTLANVVTLIEADPAQARRMLEAFTDYLRSSLTSLRRDDSTLGRELELAQAYLALIELRMDDRLKVLVDIDPALEATPLPPLLLQPLVENAVQHGLEPKVEGGTLRIGARIEGGRLLLTVEDDGVGLDAPARPGQRRNGVALHNLRERLAALHGGDAELSLRACQPGTRATLSLPLAQAPH